MAASQSPKSPSTAISIVDRLSEAFTRAQEKIRERAYLNFLDRDPDQGNSEDDWLSAQWEVLTRVNLEVKEQKKNLVVEADLKGFSPKEIEVEVGAHELKVFGSHKESANSKKRGTVASSSEEVYFYESVRLPCAVDAKGSQAVLYKNGKLKVTLPKSAE